jgi:hypothetical protein
MHTQPPREQASRETLGVTAAPAQQPRHPAVTRHEIECTPSSRPLPFVMRTVSPGCSTKPSFIEMFVIDAG